MVQTLTAFVDVLAEHEEVVMFECSLNAFLGLTCFSFLDLMLFCTTVVFVLCYYRTRD